MNINKKQRGITLIALIITIIIMLILASVIVWQAAADDGLIHKVLFSKSKVEDSKIKEKIQAAILSAKIDGTGKLEISNLKTELEKLGITAQGDSFPLNVEMENSKYTIDESGSIMKIATVSASEIAANKEKYYGQEVTNYTAGGRTYRIFYVDEAGEFGPANTIYLKADWTDNIYLLESYTSYLPKTTDILELMNPSWWQHRGSAEWTSGEHCAAFLCDPTTVSHDSNQAWADYFDSTKANYVIGCPSVEMYVKSYNHVSHTIGNLRLGACYRAIDYPGYVYTLNGTKSTISNDDYLTGRESLDYMKYNEMYSSLEEGTAAYFVWLASPSSFSDTYVCAVDVYDSQLGGEYTGSDCQAAISPLVSLRSSFLPEVKL